MGRGLSELQERILCWLLQATVEVETHGHPIQQRDLAYFGIPWRPSKGQKAWTATDRAVFSRAISRLEARRLIIRQNIASGTPGIGRARLTVDEPPPLRTTHLKLTDTGREVAERLTKTVNYNVSRYTGEP